MSTLTHFELSVPEHIEQKATVSKNFFKSDGFKAMLFSFAAGEELSDHSSKKQAVLHVLQGTGIFSTSDETVKLDTNTWIHIPAEKVHRVLAESELHFLLYLIG